MEKKKYASKPHVLSSRCYFSNVHSLAHNVVSILDEEQKKVLEDVRVLQIFEAPPVTQNIPLLYMLMSCYDVNRNIFSLGCKDISFSINDVAMILGLPNHGDEVMYAVKPYSKITKNELKQQLINMSRKVDDVQVKDLILHLLCNFFFPSSAERIPEILLRLCEPKEFLKHNWPKAVHMYLLNNMKIIAEKISPLDPAQVRTQDSIGYMHGCTHLLVVS